MLLGAAINIHTNHKNILQLGDLSQKRLRSISYMDEYGPTLHSIKGPSNVIADRFSRMLMQDTTPGWLWWGRMSQRLTPSIAISYSQMIGK